MAPKKKSKAKPVKKKTKKSAVKKTSKSSKPKLALKIKKPSKPSKQPVFKVRFGPLKDRLLVEVEGPSDVTAGGIIIPGSVSERPNQGCVVAAGTGRRNKKGQLRPLDVHVGDRVLFAQFAGTNVMLNQKEYLILREEEVLGIVT